MWLKRQQHNNTTTTWNQWNVLNHMEPGILDAKLFFLNKNSCWPSCCQKRLPPFKTGQGMKLEQLRIFIEEHSAYLHGNHIYKHQTKTKLLNVFIETTITIVDNQVFALTIQACPYIWILLHMDLSKKYSCISHQVELYFPQLISTKLTFFWGTLYKFTNTNTQIQIHKRKYTNTNTQIQLHK